MAISFDANSSPISARTNQATTSWTHSPGTTHEGVVVTTINYSSNANKVSSITYGGVSLAPLVEAVGSAHNAQLWFATGTFTSASKTVTITWTDTTTQNHRVGAISLNVTNGQLVGVVDTDTLATTAANPQITLQYGGKTCWSVNAIGGATSYTAISGNTWVYGPSGYQVGMQTTPGTSDFTIGWTGTSAAFAMAAAAFTEISASAPPSGTLTLTGAAPSPGISSTAQPTAGSVALTGLSPSAASVGISFPTGAVVLTGQTPTVGGDKVCSPGVGALTLGATSPWAELAWPRAPGWQRVWAYRGGPAATSGTTSLNWTWSPAVVVDDDILIAAISSLGASDWTTPPSGWTLIPGAQIQTGTRRLELFSRVYASETTNYTFTCPSATLCQGTIYGYRGGRAPVDVEAVATYAGAGTPTGYINYTQLGNGLTAATRDDLYLYALNVPISQGTVDLYFTSSTGDVNFPPDENLRRLTAHRWSQHASMSLASGDMIHPWPLFVGHPALSTTGSDRLLVQVLLRPRAPGTSQTRYFLTNGGYPNAYRDHDTDGQFLEGGWDRDSWGPETYSPIYPQVFSECAQVFSWGGKWQYQTLTVNAQVPGEPEATTAIRAGLAYWTTPPLAAQTLDCDLDLECIARHINSDPSPSPTLPEHEIRWSLHAYVMDEEMSTVKTTLLNEWVDTAIWGPQTEGSPYYSTGYINRPFDTPPHLGPYALTDGDRIVIEWGIKVTPLGTYPAQTDYPPQNWVKVQALIGSLDTHVGPPTPPAFVFDQVLIELTPEPGTVPTNATLATAQAISSLPYDGTFESGLLHLPMSPLWFTWTAPSSGLVLCYATGSCPLMITVWETDPVTGSWIQLLAPAIPDLDRSSPFAHTSWTAVEGTTYRILVWHDADQTSSVASGRVSGGRVRVQMQWVTPLANNDVLVAAGGKIFRYTSAGALADMIGPGGVLSGLAIDYSGQALVDQYDDSSHTAHRLLVARFDFDYIDIYDLATFSRGRTTIDALYGCLFPPSGTTPSKLSSIASAGTTVYTGWFGQNSFKMVSGSNSSFLDRAPSDADEAPLTKTDITYADSQPTYQGEPDATWRPVTLSSGGTNYVELSPDGTVLWYTSGPWYRATPTGGQTVYRWDVSGGTQLADFATLSVGAGPVGGLKGLFPLPETATTPTGGLLVCNGNAVSQLDGSGTLVATHTPSPAARALTATDVELQSDGAAFWVWDAATSTLTKFDLATGTQLVNLRVPIESGSSTSIVIYRAEAYPEPPTPPTSGDVTGGGGIVFNSASGVTGHRTARCIIFEVCPMGTLETECPEVDCITICLSPEQEQFG